MKTKYEIALETAIGLYFSEYPEDKTWEEITTAAIEGHELPDDLIVCEDYEDWDIHSVMNAVQLVAICIEDSIDEWSNQ